VTALLTGVAMVLLPVATATAAAAARALAGPVVGQWQRTTKKNTVGGQQKCWVSSENLHPGEMSTSYVSRKRPVSTKSELSA